MEIPEHVRDQFDRNRADDEQQMEKRVSDVTTEALDLLQRLRGNDADLIPLRIVCKALALTGFAWEPLLSRKGIAWYETACVAVRNAKAAIRAGLMTPRLQGSGLPVDLSRWCAADDTPRGIEEFIENSRVMVRRSDARSWLESIGAEVPAFLHCNQRQEEPKYEQPADLAAPSQPLEPTGTPKDMEGDHRPTTAAPHCAHIVRKPDRRQQGEGLFIDLRKQGVSEREAIKKVHERFGAKGLSRSSLQRAWKEASHQRPPTALAQLSEAAAKNQI